MYLNSPKLHLREEKTVTSYLACQLNLKMVMKKLNPRSGQKNLYQNSPHMSAVDPLHGLINLTSY